MAAQKKEKVISPKKTSSVKASLSAPTFSVKGEKIADEQLSEAIFGQKTNKVLLAQAVRVYLANQRSAGAKTKGRGEVTASTKKVYKQKGTGGARHGSISAPIYVGGGIAHGPNGNENYDLVLPRKLRKKALASAFSAKREAGDLFIGDLEKIEPKTKVVAQTLLKMGTKGSLVVIHSGSGAFYKAARNIKNINVISAREVTTYDVMRAKSVVLTQDALAVLEERFTTKNA